MKRKYTSAIAALAATASMSLSSCHDAPDYDTSALGTFDCLWETVDTRYCFFAEKDVDWQEVRDRYRPRVIEGITQTELFGLCSEMLAELRDGHVNLSSAFDISYYREWWSLYPQDFNWRTVPQ